MSAHCFPSTSYRHITTSVLVFLHTERKTTQNNVSSAPVWRICFAIVALRFWASNSFLRHPASLPTWVPRVAGRLPTRICFGSSALHDQPTNEQLRRHAVAWWPQSPVRVWGKQKQKHKRVKLCWIKERAGSRWSLRTLSNATKLALYVFSASKAKFARSECSPRPVNKYATSAVRACLMLSISCPCKTQRDAFCTIEGTHNM